MMIAGYFWLNDRQWEKVAPLLPAYVRGKRRVDDRRVISGIIQVILSGCRWSDAPLENGPRRSLARQHAYQGHRSASTGGRKKGIRARSGRAALLVVDSSCCSQLLRLPT